MRNFHAERFEKQNMFRGVGNVVFAADDMADFHFRIVDDDGEMVQKLTVGFSNHEVTDVFAFF